MSLYGTFDPTKVTFVLGSITAEGYADSFIKAYRNEDAFSIVVSADGKVTRVRNANRSGRFEVTLKNSSPTNDLFQAQAILDEQTGGGIAPALVKDGSGTAHAQGKNSWIVKQPDLERAKELGDVTWIIETDILDMGQGGTTPIPGT